MKSLKALYKIGRGPSSSHTMGPNRACLTFRGETPGAASFRVILYGSLADTGRGHRTDTACVEAFAPLPCAVEFNQDRTIPLPHENTMELFAYDADGQELNRMRVMSVGGGAISIEGRADLAEPEVYRENSFGEIAEYCKDRNMRLSDYVFAYEGEEIKAFLLQIWQVMNEAIHDGLTRRGILPGVYGYADGVRYVRIYCGFR